MQCPACRHENPAQAKFCLDCGFRLVVGCPSRGTELPGSAKFCLECGQRVTPSAAAIVSTSVSPDAYTPRHLAERIHWIDSESQALLDALIESLPTARILLVVDYRPEYQHNWASKTYYTQPQDRSAASRERRRVAYCPPRT